MATKRRGAPLSGSFVRTVKRPGRYGDGRGGHGLTLLVRESKNGRISRMWAQSFTDPHTSKPTMMGLGSYPRVTLAMARSQALKNRQILDAGHHPRDGGVPTFERATGHVIRLQRGAWKAGTKTEDAWRSSFRIHVFPKVGSIPVDQITTKDLLEVLEPIWNSLKSADVVRQRISMVMKWSIARGYRSDDPAEALASILPRQSGGPRKHHKALHHSEVADALATIEGSKAAPASKLAVRLLALTATRTSEVRGARWSEIDTEAKVWTVPASRMKAGRAHRVVLSGAALDVLAEARERFGGSGLVFPGRGGKPLGHASIGTLFKRLGIEGTPHGLRSSFRDWCGESGVAREVAEAALAHVVGGAEGAYARSDLLARRAKVMESWGEYLGG